MSHTASLSSDRRAWDPGLAARGKGGESQAGQVWAPLSGKGKGREERKPEGLEARKGRGRPYLPRTALAGASCPSSCKIFFPELLTRGAPRAGRGLHQGLVQGVAGDRDRGMGWWEGGAWGQEGAKDGRCRF